MMRVLSLFCLGAATAFSQPAVPSKASVSGMVKDSVGGQPLAQYNVSTFVNASWVNDTLFQSPETKQLNSVTDEEGRYKLHDLPPAAFTPPPKVRSSIVRLAFHAATPLVADEARFAKMVKALFSQRRKMLSNALKRFDPQGLSVLERSGLDGHRRPETLTLEELARLAALFAGTPETRVL